MRRGPSALLGRGAPHSSDEESTPASRDPIQLSNRVIISPYVAKRLATLLENVLKEYESRFGQLG